MVEDTKKTPPTSVSPSSSSSTTSGTKGWKGTVLKSTVPYNELPGTGLQADEMLGFYQKHLIMSSVLNERRMKYTPKELVDLCKAVVEVFKPEPRLGTINPPVVVVGDIHGQFYDLQRMFALFTKNDVHGTLTTKYVFLGDYVDRGRRSVECITLLFTLKVLYPNKFLLLRGNHEIYSINITYGFLQELQDRFGQNIGHTVFVAFNDVFQWMPVAGLIGKKILCMHGGISPHLHSLDDIRNIPKPLPAPETCLLAQDLLWSDPRENITGFDNHNPRGVGCLFGEDCVMKVCETLNIQMIVRAHQVMMSGFGMFANRRLVTVFTAPRYGGEMNRGAVMTISRDGTIGFRVMTPVDDSVDSPYEDPDPTLMGPNVT